MSDEWENPFSEAGKRFEHLGKLMQDPKTGIAELVTAGRAAGLIMSFGITLDKGPQGEAVDQEKSDE